MNMYADFVNAIGREREREECKTQMRKPARCCGRRGRPSAAQPGCRAEGDETHVRMIIMILIMN